MRKKRKPAFSESEFRAMNMATKRAELVSRWNDLSHSHQKTIVKRNHPVFSSMLERHGLAVCESCFDLFWQEECPRCNEDVHCETRFDDVNAEISRERDREIYASVR